MTAVLALVGGSRGQLTTSAISPASRPETVRDRRSRCRDGTNRQAISTRCEARVLLPALHPGRLVVVENVGAHQPERMQQLDAAAGRELVLLAAYPPDFAPV